MTQEQFEKFLEMFPNCPSPEHSPRTVEYLVKLFRYYEGIEKQALTPQAA